MSLFDWAARHNITPAAWEDLQRELGTLDASPEPSGGVRTEAGLSNRLRVLAGNRGDWLLRNNVGALLDKRGVPLRYGLANDTKALNAVMKSADLIGIRRHLVTHADVGRTLGLFYSIEVKKPGWQYSGTPHEQAQRAWALKVESMGGVARFVASEGDMP